MTLRVNGAEYGSVEGRLLASIAGHSLCLNHFGDLSEAELEADGYFHGEASNLPWTVFEQGVDHHAARLTYGLGLPEAGLRFRRQLSIPCSQKTLRVLNSLKPSVSLRNIELPRPRSSSELGPAPIQPSGSRTSKDRQGAPCR